MNSTPDFNPAAAADQVIGVLRTGRQVPTFSSRYSNLTLSLAYAAGEILSRRRLELGERIAGRKIGFTNSAMWAQYGVNAPIWSYMYDTTMHDAPRSFRRIELRGMPEPKIEPEVVFGLKRSPHPDMADAQLVECIEWVAHGFEIVQSIYPGWRFTAADTVIGMGMHAALIIGPRHAVSADDYAWRSQLSAFDLELRCDGLRQEIGHSSSVLGGPLIALRTLAAELGPARAVAPGEVIATGTITRAVPIAPGQVWESALHGIDLDGLKVAFE
jgi:2-oxo-3-hexenedioate decarboxylase